MPALLTMMSIWNLESRVKADLVSLTRRAAPSGVPMSACTGSALMECVEESFSAKSLVAEVELSEA